MDYEFTIISIVLVGSHIYHYLDVYHFTIDLMNIYV